MSEETNEPHIVFFTEDHPIFDKIAFELNVEQDLITDSPMLLIGHHINLNPILMEQYYEGPGEAPEA